MKPFSSFRKIIWVLSLVLVATCGYGQVDKAPPGGIDTPQINHTVICDTHYASVAACITAAGSSSSVIVPYGQHLGDTFTNPGNVFDLRTSVPASSPPTGSAGTVQVAGSTPGSFGAGTAANLAKTMASLFAAPNYMFGDSTTNAVGCSMYSNCFAGLLTNAHGGPSYNDALSGGTSANAVVNIAKSLNPGANINIPTYVGVLDIGINDAGGCGGTNPLCQQNYVAAQNASVAIFELTGSTYQTLAPACTLTGSWTQDTTNFAGGIYIGEVSTTNGDSFSCSIATTGNPIALEYVTVSTDGGTANCRVDTGSYQNINFFPYITTTGQLTTIFRSPEIAASAGTHTLNCIITSATSASNPVEFVAVDSIPVGQTANLPYLTMTNVISVGGSNDASSQAISDLVLPIVTAYKAEGANVTYADIRTPTNTGNDFASGVAGCPTNPVNGSGGLHPNDCGHYGIFAAIQAASPNIYQLNIGQKAVGISAQPFQAWGNLFSAMTNGSGQSGGNKAALGSANALWPGGWCPFGNSCYMFTAANGFRLPGIDYDGAFIPIINSAAVGFCLTFNGNTTITTNASFFPSYNCWTSGGDYYQYFPYTSTVGAFHPGLISRDNEVAYSGTTPPTPTRYDVTFVGPMTVATTVNLGACKNTSFSAARSIESTYYRHGNDGFPVTFTSSAAAGDNINSGAPGNSYVWNAKEGDKLTIQCSALAVGGSSWTFSAADGFSDTPTFNSIGGVGVATIALGAAGQVGTGATTPVCAAGYSCDSIGGLIQFVTGTGTLTAGVVLTITPGITRGIDPVCTVNTTSTTYLGVNATSTTAVVHINASIPLQPSTAYNFSYSCVGN